MHLSLCLDALLGVGLTAATRSRSSIPPEHGSIIPGAFIVEFMAGHDHTSFYSSLALDGVDIMPRMNMSFKLFNGSSFSITDRRGHASITSKISIMPSIKRIWPMHLYPAPTLATHRLRGRVRDTPFPNLDDFGQASNHGEATAAGNYSYSPHLMTQVDRLHASGYNGKGARIAIIDTGVDYKHPALGGCFGKGCLISGGYDLAGHKYDGTSPPEPAPYPYDSCNGHGTHVAGIIGARPNKMGFTGVAPGAALSMYKVFSCLGGTSVSTDDILIAAFNMAYEDGADIITASIGGPGGWSETPWSSVVGRIVENGVPCTLAAGNDGWRGMWAPSHAADGKGVTAVSSFDNVRTPYILYNGSYSTNSSSFGANSGSASKPFGWLPGYPRFVENLTLPLFATSRNASVEDDACAALPHDTPILSNLFVLIRTSKACSIHQQLKNVLAYDARNILFYGSSMDDLSLSNTVPAPSEFRLNGLGFVLAEQGAEWAGLLDRGLGVRISIYDESNAEYMLTETKNEFTGGFASYYTSWGPTLELDVFPTVGAPGGNILSTYLLSEGGYAVDSGTSMATPFMAGVFALVRQVRGTLNPTELLQYISTTSRAQRWNDGTGTFNGLAPVLQQGAGLVQAYDAAFTTTQINSKGVSFNDTHNLRIATFTIRNTGSETVTYNLRNSPALSMLTFGRHSNSPLEYPNAIIATTADLHFSNNSVRIPPNGRANITVKPTVAKSPGLREGLLPMYSGYIAINGSNGENLSVPYFGVAGSMYDTIVMTRNDYSAHYCPADASSSFGDKTTFTVPYPSSEKFVPEPTFETLGMYPSVSFNLNLGTRILRADVIALSPNYSHPTTTVLGRKIAGSVYGFPEQYVARLPKSVYFTGMLDDGTIVPQGEYSLSIKALKFFGDPEKPQDYEGLFVDNFTLLYQD